MTKFHIGAILTGALLCFAPATMALNAWAVFIVPVSEELGVSTGLFSLQPSIIYLSSALFAPIGGRLIERFDLKIVLTGCSIAVGLAFMVSAVGNQLWQFFLIGAVDGCAGVVLIALMLPNLISRWFSKKMGTVVGVCIAMSGLGGALWAYLAGLIMVAADWHVAYMVLGIICLLVSLPACFFLLKNRPSDVGVVPYGQDDFAQGHCTGEGSAQDDAQKDAPQLGVPAKIAFASAVFLLFAAGVGLLNGVIGMANLLPTYVYYLGDAGFFSMTPSEVIIAASTIALCTQVSQACCKVAMGVLADRNAKLAFVVAVGAGIAAVFCFLFGKTVPMIVFAGGVLFGFLFAVLDVLSPVLVRSFFGDRDYPRIYARFALITNIVPAFAVFIFASISDVSWMLAFLLAGACLTITMVFGITAMRKSKGLAERFQI